MSLTKNSSTTTTATAKDSEHRTPSKQDEDELTACETPLSSPEFQSPIVTRKMKKELDQQVTESNNQQEQSSLEDEDQQASLGEAKKAEAAEVGADEDEEEDDTQDYTNWPLEGIKDPSKNDVLYGRGGGTNHHDGNKRYRKLVEGRKVDYVNSKRLDKPLVSLDIIREWRGQRPPGRFLKFDEKKEVWLDVGDKKAREKTSQALREKAPLLRKQQEEQMMELADTGSNIESCIGSPVTSAEVKSTRFNVSHEGVRPSKNVGRSQLCREDSLGGHYVADHELSMKDFSWDDIEAEPREENAADDPQIKQGWNPPPPLCESRPSYSASAEPAHPLHYDDFRPVVPVSHHWQQHSVHHPAHPAASAPPSDDRLQTTWANRSYDEDQVQPYDDLRQTRSAEDDYRSNSYRGQDNRWSQGGSVRSPNEGYDHGHGSTYMNRWDGYHNGYHYPNPADNRGPPPYSHVHHQWASPNRYNPYHGQYQMPEHIPQSAPRSAEHSYPPPQMGYDHNGYGNPEVPQNSLPVQNSPHKRMGLDYGNCNESESSCSPSRSIPKPQPIKRDTSHQNETSDTKSQVKRLNRQRSIGSRRQVNENDMYNLGRHLRQSSIGINDAPSYPLKRPENIREENRTMTIDQADIATAIEGSSSPLDRPSGIKYEGRSNSLDSIGLEDVNQLVFSSLNKPSSLGDADRYSTFGTVGTES